MPSTSAVADRRYIPAIPSSYMADDPSAWWTYSGVKTVLLNTHPDAVWWLGLAET